MERKSQFILALIVALPAACSGPSAMKQTNDTTDPESTLDAWVLGLGHLEVDPAQPPTPAPCIEDGEEVACPEAVQEGDQICSYQSYVETAQFDTFVAFQPNSATLWPGAVVRGKDAEAGLLTPVGVDLAPVTFSVSLENLDGSPVGSMAEPSLSAFREAQNAILAADVTGSVPAKLEYRIHEIYAESQLALALGASVDWPGGNEIAAGFDFSSESKKTRVVVDFTQAYYTADVNTPARPSDFFGDQVTVDDLDDFVSEGNPPVYVQSITYGRRVIFTVETTAARDELEAALSAAYQGAVGASVDVSVAYENILEEAKIHAFVLGGSSADATAVIDGFAGLSAYIQRGGDYGKDSPGAPIAYKLAYLDNAVTQMSFTTEYAERKCTGNRARLGAELVEIDHVAGGDVGGNIELYGWITVRAPVGGDPVTACDEGGEVVALWELSEGQWVDVEKFGSWEPPSPITTSIENVAVGPGEHLCLQAHVWDNDSQALELSGNDDFGGDSVMIGWDEGWPGSHVLQARGEGDRAVDLHLRLDLYD